MFLRILFVFCSGLLIFSCKRPAETKSAADAPSGNVISFGRGESYSVNPFTGTPVESGANSVTGKLINLQPFTISGDTMPPVSVSAARAPEITVSAPNWLSFYPPKAVPNKWQQKGTVQPQIKTVTKLREIFVKPVITKAGTPFFRDNTLFDLKYLDADQGLKSPYILSIFKQSDGHIWIGMFNGGLCRYDGKQFEQFGSPLEMGTVSSTMEDNDGNIWITTFNEGLYCYDGYSFKDYRSLLMDPEEPVSSVRKYKGGVIIATEGKFIYQVEKNRLITTNLKKFIPAGEYLTCAEINNAGEIIFFTDKSGFRIRDNNVEQLAGFAPDRITGVSAERDNSLWISTSTGAINLTEKSSLTYGVENGLTGEIVNAVKKLGNGTLCFATSDGLTFVHEGKVSRINRDSGLTENWVTDICDDESGNLWLATNGGGVCIFKQNSFEHFTEQNGLTDYIIKTISNENDNELWMGAFPGDLIKVEKARFLHYSSGDNEQDYIVYALVKDKQDGLWYNEWGNALYYRYGNTIAKYGFERGLSANRIRNIVIDKNGDVWLGTVSGICKIENPRTKEEKFLHFREKHGFLSDRINDMKIDPKGGIWVASEGGLSHFPDPSENNVIHYTQKEGLPHNSVQCLTFNGSDLYFGTAGGGMGVIAGGQLKVFNEIDGLSSPNVNGISVDSWNKVWISTTSGLNVMFPSRGGRKPIFMQFGKADGLKGSDFYRGSNCIDNLQQLWIGSGKGLTRLDLKKWSVSSAKPKIFINEVKVNGIGSEPDSLDKQSIVRFSARTQSAVVPYNQNHFTFYFSAIDWSSPHDLKYSYRVKNLSEEWSSWSDEASADFRGLSDGDYTFEVRAKSKSGVISNSRSFPFTVNSPWWKTWWAYLIFMLSFVFLIQIITKFRTRRLKVRQRELESEVENRTTELKEEKQKVTEKNHEILDSIAYAKRIQDAILPDDQTISELLAGASVYYQPKDIVAGDFYWLRKERGLIWFAIADCTGHGVPGALVSVVCSNALNKALEDESITAPGELLNLTRTIVVEMFSKSGQDVKDGMDISLCAWQEDSNTLFWSGANNPLWIVRENKLLEWKPAKQPIGKFDYAVPFETQIIELETNDFVVLFTDGFQDQFGGDKKKKLKVAGWRSVVLDLAAQPESNSVNFLDNWFNDWKKDEEQLDDVCLLTWRFKNGK